MPVIKTFGYVYILSNISNSVLYIGVTSNIFRRIMEHKSKRGSTFSAKYNLNKLVYYKSYDSIAKAITEEKRLKNWKRNWKNELIETINPQWTDLSASWVDNEWFIEDLIN